MISSLPKGPTSSKQYLGSYESEQNTNIKLTALPKWHDIRRKGILVYATVAWMNSDNLMLSEISQHRKSKYGMNLLKVHRFISQKEGPLAETARVYHPRNSVSSCSKMSKLHSQRHLFRFSFWNYTNIQVALGRVELWRKFTGGYKRQRAREFFTVYSGRLMGAFILLAFYLQRKSTTEKGNIAKSDCAAMLTRTSNLIPLERMYVGIQFKQNCKAGNCLWGVEKTGISKEELYFVRQNHRTPRRCEDIFFNYVF